MTAAAKRRPVSHRAERAHGRMIAKTGTKQEYKTSYRDFPMGLPILPEK
jgi:hypothetical protein